MTRFALAAHRRTAAAAVAAGVVGAACVVTAARVQYSAVEVLVVAPSPVYAAADPDLVAARALADTGRLPAGATLDVDTSGPVLRVAATAQDSRTAVRLANQVVGRKLPTALRAQVADGLRARGAAVAAAAPDVVRDAELDAALAAHGLEVSTVRRATAATPLGGGVQRAVALARLDGLPAVEVAPADAGRLLVAAMRSPEARGAVVGGRDATLEVRPVGAAVEIVVRAGSAVTADEAARDAASGVLDPLDRVLHSQGLPDRALVVQPLGVPAVTGDESVPGWLLALLALAGLGAIAGAVLDARERRRARGRAARRARRTARARRALPNRVRSEGWAPVRLSEWPVGTPDVGVAEPAALSAESLSAESPVAEPLPAEPPVAEPLPAEPPVAEPGSLLPDLAADGVAQVVPAVPDGEPYVEPDAELYAEPYAEPDAVPAGGSVVDLRPLGLEPGPVDADPAGTEFAGTEFAGTDRPPVTGDLALPTWASALVPEPAPAGDDLALRDGTTSGEGPAETDLTRAPGRPFVTVSGAGPNAAAPAAPVGLPSAVNVLTATFRAPFAQPEPPATPPFRPVERPGGAPDSPLHRPFEPSAAALSAQFVPGVALAHVVSEGSLPEGSLPDRPLPGGAGGPGAGPAAESPDAADPAWTDILGVDTPRPARSRFRSRR